MFLFFFILLSINQLNYSDTITQISVQNFLQKYPESQALQCTNNYSFNIKPFPLYPEIQQDYFPSTGIFADIFILNIPHGCSYLDQTGYIFINDHFIAETQIRFCEPNYLSHISVPTK